MVVILLLGLTIIGIAVGGFLTLRDTEELKNESRSLAGFLEHVRSKSALRGKRYVVEYNLDPDEWQGYFAWSPRESGESEERYDYSIVDDDAYQAVGQREMPWRRRGDGSRVYVVWIDRIAFADGSVEDDDVVQVDFRPSGGSHWHYVYLTNSEGDFYTIEVNPFTGDAEIYPGEVEPEEPIRVD